MRQARKKMTIREFEPLTIIGRGAFGEVRVCRQISTGDIVAIKKMRKEDMLKKNQLMHVRTEREIMTSSSEWIVNLKYSFQDEYYLYLVMDYLPGGDLMNLLIKKEILTEEEARFYTAEMILAVDSVHKLNCIHRDLKPDNILIDKNGHIQLSDFGLSKLSDKAFYPMSIKDSPKPPKKIMNKGNNSYKATNMYSNIKINLNNSLKNKKFHKKNRLLAYSTVGTPDYIAPEVFGSNGYGQEVDWWSIGVMFFEMVVGYPPFFSENPSDTCKKIIKWKENFSIPEDAELSSEAENLILKMVAPAEVRLGINGIEEIKRHPFFKGVDWNNIRKGKAPFIPDIKNDYDTKYFDTFPEEEPFYPPISGNNKQRKDVNYAGYTFNRDNENIKDSFLQALEVLESVKKTTEAKKEKEIITDESNFQFNDKNIHNLENENIKNYSSNNVRNKINYDEKKYKSFIKINNYNTENNNKNGKIIQVPNKLNYVKKNKDAKFNNNLNNRNNKAPLKKTAKSPGILTKISNTMQTSKINIRQKISPKKVSPLPKSNKDNKLMKKNLKINIDNNCKIDNKKIFVKPTVRQCKTRENKVGKSPGTVLKKEEKTKNE